MTRLLVKVLIKCLSDWVEGKGFARAISKLLNMIENKVLEVHKYITHLSGLRETIAAQFYYCVCLRKFFIKGNSEYFPEPVMRFMVELEYKQTTYGEISTTA